MDLIHHPVISNPYSIKVFIIGKLLHTRWPWIRGQPFNTLKDAALYISWEFSYLSSGKRSELYLVRHASILETKLFFQP